MLMISPSRSRSRAAVKPGQPGCGSTSVMTVTPVHRCPRRSGSRTVRTGKVSIHKITWPVTAVCFRPMLTVVTLYESGRITEAACMAHARRKIHDVHARAPTYITTEALQRIGELYAIEAEVRGCSAEQRLAARKARAAPLMQSLYDWIQQQMKTLSRHSDTAKAFAYLLKQWDALNVYCSNGWVEIDNNIAENALRGVAVGRKNWMFAGSDSGGEHAAVLYSLIGTCRLNNVEPEKWLRYVIEHIQDWPANRVRDLLPWKVDLSSQ